MTEIGTHSNAWLAALVYRESEDILAYVDHPVAKRDMAWADACYYAEMDGKPAPTAPAAFRCIGVGESRTAYLIEGIVYKVGRRSANEYEHQLLAEWRDAGAHWAPPTTLHEVTIVDPEFGDKDHVLVIAMPYYADDDYDNAEDLAAIKAAAPQTCPENWRSTGGRTYLIDGVDVEYSPR